MMSDLSLKRFRRRILFCAAVFLIGGLTAGPAAAQGRLTDTLRVVSTSAYPGDSIGLFLYIANYEQLGGYTVRFDFDTSLFEFYTLDGGSSVIPAIQLRGDFKSFRFGMPEPDIAAGSAFFPSPSGLQPGSSITIELPFRIKDTAPLGSSSSIEFVDAPFDTNASNWFSSFDGLYQYRPIRIPGFITVGEQPALDISCPQNLTVSCDDPLTPSSTGSAAASDQAADVTYDDERINGNCPDGYTIVRTWTASLLGDEATCQQTITVRDIEPPSLVCPPDINIEFSNSILPENTGFASAFDNCDNSVSPTYSDAETPGSYPVERTIWRTWMATDACGNDGECVQRIRELAEGVVDTTTIPGDEDSAVLYQNWPNPFQLSAVAEDSIKYALPYAGPVKLSIHDLVGRRYKTLVDEIAEGAGTYRVGWDGRDADGNYVPSGIYFIRLRFADKTVIKKMAVIR